MAWPLVRQGFYADGTLCTAADYRADFDQLIDAANELYERFASYTFQAHHTERVLAGATAVGITAAVAARLTLNIFRVPTWMQGIRVREFHVVNSSNIQDLAGYGQTNGPITFGVSTSSSLSDFDLVMTATDITTVTSTELWLEGQAGPTTTPKILSSTGLSRVLAPADYLCIWGAGADNFNALAADENFHFNATVLMDAMVPAP